jgi:hypothetical protein
MDRKIDSQGRKRVQWGFLIFDAIVINGEVGVSVDVCSNAGPKKQETQSTHPPRAFANPSSF